MAGAPPDDLDLFAGRDRDPRARETLVERYHGLAVSLARRFEHRGEELDDLIQVADIGLLQAIDRFDPERGVRFTTFATVTIVGELKRHFRDKGWAVHVSRRLQETSLRVNAALPELTQELGRQPTIAELAERLDVGPDEIGQAMEVSRAYAASSLEAPTDAREDTPTVADRLGEEDPSYAVVEHWRSIAPAVADLPERERLVLYLRFFRQRTQSEIAAEIGVSQMHVSRILARTLEQLRAEA